ncbi:SDR family oxidoreductase [Microbacterium sp. Leaf179]|uniref:SDR family oxidoreductase n=1 Tax=Microbacterium sp. Leaf179 TaxID=1736288 RepID=UPI0009EA9AF1|nr:SDR family oxidoreductase [Microbacterium sp. Leaf179]
MIVVTGATGALNGATVDRLLMSLPPSDLAVMARDPAKAARFAARGVDVRVGDYADPRSLRAAFAGADHLLLVSSSDHGADVVELHRIAIDAAVAAGVGRIFYTSHQGASSISPFAPMRDHAKTEQILADSGVPWTALRNGSYTHTLEYFLGDWRESGFIDVPSDGQVSWTAREDAAEGAALVLLSNEAYDGPVTMTAATAPSFADIAQIASESSGRPVEIRVLGEDEWVDKRVAGGEPDFLARFMLGFYLAAAADLFAGVDPLLSELLQRSPRTVQSHLESVNGRD